MKKVSALLLTVMLGALALSSQPVKSQDLKNQKDEKPAGKIVRSYRGDQGGERPGWAEAAHARSLEFLKQHGRLAASAGPTPNSFSSGPQRTTSA